MAFFSYDPAIGRAAMAQMPGVISEAGAVGGGGSPFGKGFGNFLRAWAGHMGDYLTGNPVFAQNIQAQQEMERQQAAYDRKLADEKAWWYEQQNYRAANEQPDLDADIREFQQLKALGYVPQEMSYEGFARMKNPGAFIPPPPIKMDPGDVVEQTGDVTATNPQTGEKIRLNPRTGKWETIGGAGSQAPRGFP